MIFSALLLLLIGLAVLVYGGDIFVKGASSVAGKLRVSPMVIGLTIVAFGTSAPELMVNIFAATSGAPELAIGNILGSNIANILLILGICALIRPLRVKKGTTFKEIPFGFLAVVVLFFLVNDILFGAGAENLLSRGDGLVLIAIFAIFLVYTYGLTKVEGDTEKVDTYSWIRSTLYILGGLAGLIVGGKFIVDNATILAQAAGLSELFIGLTIAAIGTSLPELATSAIATYRGHQDLAVGNVVGSNIFNILWILGVTPIITPFTVAPSVNIDIAVAGIAAILLFGFMLRGGPLHRHSLRRYEGIFFILIYVSYITYISFRG